MISSFSTFGSPTYKNINVLVSTGDTGIVPNLAEAPPGSVSPFVFVNAFGELQS